MGEVMDADVIVVGAGPSGLTTAAELLAQGAQVIVLERRTGPVQSRAGTILPRVLELLDSRGHADLFIERARRIRKNPFLLFHIWGGMQQIDWRRTGAAFPYRLILPQHVTEDVLRGIAVGSGVDVREGRTVVGLEQDANGVRVEAELEEGGVEVVRAKYVVGADGGRSPVRKLAGIPFEGHDGTFTGIIVDIPVNMNWALGRAMTDNEHGWGASFPFGEDGSSTRFNFVHAERRHADKSEPVTVEEVKRCLKEIFGLEPEFDHLLWASRFTDAMRLVPRMRDGRVFLVGESVRIHYPASGVGMNFCIQDAFDLGWKLGRVVTGISPQSVLDTYEADRRPVVEGLLESVRAQCAIQFDFTEEGIALRRMFTRDFLALPDLNRALGLQLNGLTHPYPTAASDHPVAGRPVPEMRLHTLAGERRLAELLRAGELLLLDFSGDNRFEGVSAPQLATHSGVVPQPAEGWSGVTAAIIRPDGYVHWVTTDAEPDIEEVRARLADWVVLT